MDEFVKGLREIDPSVAELFDKVATVLFGRTRAEALDQHICVACGGPAVEFKDEKSRAEYGITMLCQTCQDEIFGM